MAGYDAKRLIGYIGLWWSMRDMGNHADNGFTSCSAIHRMASSNRQWDSDHEILDDRLDREICRIMGDAMVELPLAQRAMVIVTHCQPTPSQWDQMTADALAPETRQQTLDDGMQALAISVQNNGLEL